MLNLYYATDRKLKVGLKINLDSHHNNHAISKLTIITNYPGVGIEIRYINKIMKELTVIYARLLNQYIFKNQTVFSAKFEKQDENNQVLDEPEIFNNLNNNHNLTETGSNNIDIRSPLEHQIQQQEMKDSGWRFDKFNSMIIYFYKTGEMNGSSYVRIPLKANAILNIDKNDNYCFLWSILASLHLCNINHPNRVSNYKQYFNELNIIGFDFTNGFLCSDAHQFNEIKYIIHKHFEIFFFQDQNKLICKGLPSEVSKNESNRVIDFLFYKNHYTLIKNINVSLGDPNKNFICRRCLNSYTSENKLMIHK